MQSTTPASAASAGTPGRTSGPAAVTAAAVVLVVLGVLTALGAVIGLSFANALGLPGVAVALFALAFGAVEIASGIRLVSLRNSWRIVGLGLAAAGGVLILLGSIAHQLELSFDGEPGMMRLMFAIVQLLAVAAHAFVVAALVRSGSSFWR